MRRPFTWLVVALIVPIMASAANVKWKQPRTPWGDPDLQGMWPVVHPLQAQRQLPVLRVRLHEDNEAIRNYGTSSRARR